MYLCVCGVRPSDRPLLASRSSVLGWRISAAGRTREEDQCKIAFHVSYYALQSDDITNRKLDPFFLCSLVGCCDDEWRGLAFPPQGRFKVRFGVWCVCSTSTRGRGGWSRASSPLTKSLLQAACQWRLTHFLNFCWAVLFGVVVEGFNSFLTFNSTPVRTVLFDRMSELHQQEPPPPPGVIAFGVFVR